MQTLVQTPPPLPDGAVDAPRFDKSVTRRRRRVTASSARPAARLSHPQVLGSTDHPGSSIRPYLTVPSLFRPGNVPSSDLMYQRIGTFALMLMMWNGSPFRSGK